MRTWTWTTRFRFWPSGAVNELWHQLLGSTCCMSTGCTCIVVVVVGSNISTDSNAVVVVAAVVVVVVAIDVVNICRS